MSLNESNQIYPGRANRFTAQRRTELLSQFEESKASAAAFARQIGIGLSTLHAWRRKERQAANRVIKKVAKFQSVPPIALSEVLGTANPWVGEVSLPDGTQLRWNQQARPAVLRELVRSLRRPC